MIITTLEPLGTNQKSFYGKAKIVTFLNFNDDIVSYDLFSYDTLVATINHATLTPIIYGLFSKTTTKHIKEFLNQFSIYVKDTNDLKKYIVETK